MRKWTLFRRNESGTVSIDFVIWIPVFCAILTFAVDISLTFYGYSRMWDVARDTGRRVATGQFDAAEAQIYALSQLPGTGSYNVYIDDTGEDDVIVEIVGANLSPVWGSTFWGAVEIFSIESLAAVYTMRKEGKVTGGSTSTSGTGT